MDIEMINNFSDEDYVIQNARSALKVDPISAKAWMLTAKTLYPNNFGVQYEAYQIEKDAGNIKEAARNFSDLIGKFHQQQEFWLEVNKVTTALRSDTDGNEEKAFYTEMFKYIEPEKQHKLLLLTADHCDDTMEHCRLILLLLEKFPNSIQNHAMSLADTLLSAEKHSHSSNQPINPYRKMLIHELIPLLNEQKTFIEFSPKLVYKLVHKGIEYYLHSAAVSNIGQVAVLEESWRRLCTVIEFAGKQLNWEPYLTSFGETWNKEHYWQKLMTFRHSKGFSLDDQNAVKQLVYCVTIFFLHCLNEYKISLAPEPHPGQIQTSYLLVEAFVDASLPAPTSEPKSKRRKTDIDGNSPVITVERPESNNIVNNFTLTRKCWELLNSNELLQREYAKLNSVLKLNNILSQFLIDYSIYKGHIDDTLNLISQNPESVATILRLSSLMYFKKNFIACLRYVIDLVELLNGNAANHGELSGRLISGGARHLHYLPLTRINVLQYCTKLLIGAISERDVYNDSAIGNTIVLAQLDWPQEEDRIPPLLESIRQRGGFQYHQFQSYVVNIDIIEELSYLFTRQVSLEITPHAGQRRIGTRGADKGVKEEVRQAIRRQIARSNEPLDQLIADFILKERESLNANLM